MSDLNDEPRESSESREEGRTEMAEIRNRESTNSSANVSLWQRPPSVVSSPVLSGRPPSGPPSQQPSLRRRASSATKPQESVEPVVVAVDSPSASPIPPRPLEGEGAPSIDDDTETPVEPSKLSREPISLVLNSHLTPEQIQAYMVYTHTQPVPKKWNTIREYRSIFRLLQALTSAGAFATIFYSSIANSHQSFVLTESGVSLMCLTSISAFVSLFRGFSLAIIR
jgi:hypothetical protein